MSLWRHAGASRWLDTCMMTSCCCISLAQSCRKSGRSASLQCANRKFRWRCGSFPAMPRRWNSNTSRCGTQQQDTKQHLTLRTFFFVCRSDKYLTTMWVEMRIVVHAKMQHVDSNWHLYTKRRQPQISNHHYNRHCDIKRIYLRNESATLFDLWSAARHEMNVYLYQVPPHLHWASYTSSTLRTHIDREGRNWTL